METHSLLLIIFWGPLGPETCCLIPLDAVILYKSKR